jgi:hypothetical protein
VITSSDWDVAVNNGNTFTPSIWASVHTDLRNPENWEFYDSYLTLKDHAFPKN